jgi:hypothetical protein
VIECARPVTQNVARQWPVPCWMSCRSQPARRLTQYPEESFANEDVIRRDENYRHRYAGATQRKENVHPGEAKRNHVD